LACWEAAAQGAPPPPVSVAKPVVKELVEWDEFTGRFAAMATVDVRARVSGWLERVAFADGALVNDGDLLFVIDRRPYQATVNQLEAELTAARTRADFAKSEFDRFERLARTGTAPERTLDEKRQAYLAAQAEIGAARAALDKVRLDLGFTEIRSPIAGRIGRKLVSEGNLVTANETLLTSIVSIDPIHFYFDVDERSFLAYQRMARESGGPSARDSRLPVRLSLTGESEFKLSGYIDFVDNRLDEATGTMRVRAVVENKDRRLTPGLFGRIQIPGSPLYRAVLVPDEAIGADLDRRFVFVVGEDGSVRQQVVRPGSRQDGYRIVRSGLTGEETIVVDGLMRVRFGGKITPKPIDLPPSR